MSSSSVNEVSTSGRTNESDNEGEVGLEQFLGFPGVKSTVERKKSLLDEVAEEETELELVLEGLGLSKKKGLIVSRTSSAQSNLTMSKIVQKFLKKWMLKSFLAPGATESGEVTKEKKRWVESSGEKVAKARPAAVDDLREVEERARLAALHGEDDTSKMVARLVKVIWLDIEKEKSELKKAKSELEKDLTHAKTEAMKEVKQLKASYVVAIGQLQAEAKANLDETVEKRDRLGRHLMLKGYSEEEVDAIKADTYDEEGEDEETEVVGVVDGLDGVSCQTVLDNQGDDVELPEGRSEKVIREMCLRINDLESGLAREKKTSKALLSTEAELGVIFVEKRRWLLQHGAERPINAPSNPFEQTSSLIILLLFERSVEGYLLLCADPFSKVYLLLCVDPFSKVDLLSRLRLQEFLEGFDYELK
ncbi:hypothetical protein GIB67_028298 [Kingdonia uniflora]|uniref:Uncharacterized protein n=1 Tax=Kingdonia uniflora TaxID=39325 RepID=A0A7J7MHN4_9MAGN|nr:hypothetical protein GIB67_028298 [Kingdonia uniflora]